MRIDWPYATKRFEGIAGTLKARHEDFRVEEIPAYEPSGSGEHIYFTIEKRGLSTSRAIRDIAKALGVKAREIGYAGLKDARGITVQNLSISRVDPGSIENLNVSQINIIEISRHKNKLKMGHLKGNRFVIKLRDVDPRKLDDVRAVSNILTSRGVPNYFGIQRFGNRGDTWKIGKSLLLGDFEDAAALIAGKAGPEDTGRVLEARELFDQGKYEESAFAWPRGFSECVRVCRGLKGTVPDFERAVMGLDRRSLKFYVSAYQSHLFNRVLAGRIEGLDQIEVGDIAWKHINGAAFVVEDALAETPRAESFEISATGPLFGPKMTLPRGRTLQLEESVLKDEGISRNIFGQAGPLKSPGGRRPLRFEPKGFECERGEDEYGSFIELTFTLPSGCYATAVLREICKDQLISL